MIMNYVVVAKRSEAFGSVTIIFLLPYYTISLPHSYSTHTQDVLAVKKMLYILASELLLCPPDYVSHFLGQ